MRFVVDANVVISGLISDSATRRLLIEIEPNLLTPAYVYDEVDKHTEMVMEKSGLEEHEVEQLIHTLFKRIEVIPRAEITGSMQEAARAMRDADPDDAMYVAAALERDAALWSDDGDYDNQDLVDVATTTDIFERFNKQTSGR
jgi:predicted nucleic acid-binding protein